MGVSCLPTRLIVVFCHWLRPCSCLHSKTCNSIGRFFSERCFQKRGRCFQKRGRSFQKRGCSQGHQKRNETKIVLGFPILKMFPPSQTVLVFHQLLLSSQNKVFKNVDIPKGTKKRNETQIVVGFVISKTFPPSQTALVFRLPTLFQRNAIFKNVDIPNETKIADHVMGFLTFHSFLEHGCQENPQNAPSQEQSQN